MTSVTVAGRRLGFRNWQALQILPADLDAARKLRDRTGLDSVVAEMTLDAIRASETRPGTYDAHVAQVVYRSRTGEELARIDAPAERVSSADETAAGAAAIRATLEAAAGLPVHGVIEMPGTLTLTEALAAFGATSEAAGVTLREPLVAYDREDLRLARKAPVTGGLGVTAMMATAGAPAAGTLPYDPLARTTGITNPGRQVSLFAVAGADDRVPVNFVLAE